MISCQHLRPHYFTVRIWGQMGHSADHTKANSLALAFLPFKGYTHNRCLRLVNPLFVWSAQTSTNPHWNVCSNLHTMIHICWSLRNEQERLCVGKHIHISAPMIDFFVVHQWRLAWVQPHCNDNDTGGDTDNDTGGDTDNDTGGDTDNDNGGWLQVICSVTLAGHFLA